MGEEVEITTKSPSRLPSRSAPLCPPRIPASVSIPPDVIRHLPHPLRSTPLCPSPHLGPCFYSAGCYPAFSYVYSPALNAGFLRLVRGSLAPRCFLFCLFRRMLSGIPSSLCIPPASLREPITQTTLPFLTGLFHSHPRFYSPGMGSAVPLLISPVVPPNPTLAQIIVCGIIST